MLICKRLGDDLKLVAPVVVLSSSTAVFGMHISPGDLRAKFVEVDDLSEVEACSLLFKALEKVEGSHDMKKIAVDLAISETGTRLVHLHCVVSETQSRSLDEFILMAKLCQQQYEDLYHMAFIQFVELCPKLKTKRYYTRSQVESVNCVNFLRYYVQIIEHNGQIEPHLLYTQLTGLCKKKPHITPCPAKTWPFFFFLHL